VFLCYDFGDKQFTLLKEWGESESFKNCHRKLEGIPKGKKLGEEFIPVLDKFLKCY
jgi:hypothetical protein